jgi:hypothetical protein
MPAVTVMMRCKGAITLEQVKENAKKAKALVEKHGAELFRVVRFHTGNFVGEWLVVAGYPSWAPKRD